MKTINNTAVSTIVETEEGKILKRFNVGYAYVYPSYLFCSNCQHTNILKPEKVTFREDQLEILMPKGQVLTRDSKVDNKKLLVGLLDAFCYLESFNLIHGDIKPPNIVVWNDEYCLIDFDILVNKGDNTTLTQSYNNIYGYALKANLQTTEYNNFTAALYALACTLMVYAKNENRPFYDSDRMLPERLAIQDMVHTFPCSKTAIAIHRNPSEWIQEHFEEDWWDFIGKLIGPNKFHSFREARQHSFLSDFPFEVYPELASASAFGSVIPNANDVNNDSNTCTRNFYDLACKKRIHTHLVAQVFDLYYKYYDLEEDKIALLEACLFPYDCDYDNPLAVKILEQDKGMYLTELLTENFEARLLLEYLKPGTWPLRLKLSMQEVQKLKSLDQPKMILLLNYSMVNPVLISDEEEKI